MKILFSTNDAKQKVTIHFTVSKPTLIPFLAKFTEEFVSTFLDSTNLDYDDWDIISDNIGLEDKVSTMFNEDTDYYISIEVSGMVARGYVEYDNDPRWGGVCTVDDDKTDSFEDADVKPLMNSVDYLKEVKIIAEDVYVTDDSDIDTDEC